jgi:hypothetical protein
VLLPLRHKFCATSPAPPKFGATSPASPTIGATPPHYKFGATPPALQILEQYLVLSADLSVWLQYKLFFA